MLLCCEIIWFENLFFSCIYSIAANNIIQLSIIIIKSTKNKVENITKGDEQDFKELAKSLLSASDAELKNLVEQNKFLDIWICDHIFSLTFY